MFGYIRIYKPELRFREYDLYQGCYCGLCETLSRQYGTVARWTLSYDMTFLTMLLNGLYEPEEQMKKCRCVVHPLRKQLHLCSDVTTYAADMSILLYREKCIDDWNDEKKLSRCAAAQVLQHSYQKTQMLYPQKTERIAQHLQQLHQIESKNEPNPEIPAGCFGEILAEIFAWKTDEWEQTLREIGFYLGKFVYLLDAYDDLSHDQKKDCYNPLLPLSNRADFEQTCEQMLQMAIASCAQQFERLPILKYADILRNVLYGGVWAQFRQMQQKKQKEK